VVAELVLARYQPKILRLDRRIPGTPLGADRTVAAARTGLEIDIGLEAHTAAVAAAMVGFLHSESSSSLYQQ
jgi:hypothetical protein